MNRSKLATFLFLTLSFCAKGQSSNNLISDVEKQKIYKAISKAYIKSKAHDTSYYEGFIILQIVNPYGESNGRY